MITTKVAEGRKEISVRSCPVRKNVIQQEIMDASI